MQKSVPPSVIARHDSIVLKTYLMTPEFKIEQWKWHFVKCQVLYSFFVVNNRCCHDRDQSEGG